PFLSTLVVVLVLACFLLYHCAPQACPSFPTRRSSDLRLARTHGDPPERDCHALGLQRALDEVMVADRGAAGGNQHVSPGVAGAADRKSTRLNSSHQIISYAVFCLKNKTSDGSRTAERP